MNLPFMLGFEVVSVWKKITNIKQNNIGITETNTWQWSSVWTKHFVFIGTA